MTTQLTCRPQQIWRNVCVTEEYSSEFRDWQDQGHLSALCTYWMSLLPGKSHSWHTSYQSSEHPLTRHVFEASQLQEPVGHFFLLEVPLESSLKLNCTNEFRDNDRLWHLLIWEELIMRTLLFSSWLWTTVLDSSAHIYSILCAGTKYNHDLLQC